MAHDIDDADAIRARRALLISTALAALSCGSPGDGAVPSNTSAASATGTATSATTTTATASATPAAAPLRAWAEVLEAAPPRGVPAVATGAEGEWLKHLENDLEKRYETVRLVWESTPGCDAAASDCRAAWRELGVKAKAMYDANRGRGFGGCGGANGETASLVGRRQAHNDYLQSLISELEVQLTKVADGFSPQGGQEWQRILANAKKPPPMPCLSPCPMPEVTELLQRVSFQTGSAAIDDEAQLQGVLGQYNGNKKPSKIIVRGHADPLEPKAAELAKQRADKVTAWLVGKGVPKERVETRSYGAELPVRRSKTPEGAAENRRVDFEAVPL